MKNFYPAGVFQSCLQFRNVNDQDGNRPIGYRLVVTWDGVQKWHDREAVIHYVSYEKANFDRCGSDQERGGLADAPSMLFLETFNSNPRQYISMTVQAYDVDGVGKGTGWRPGEIAFTHNTNYFDRYIDRPEGLNAEDQ